MYVLCDTDYDSSSFAAILRHVSTDRASRSPLKMAYEYMRVTHLRL